MSIIDAYDLEELQDKAKLVPALQESVARMRAENEWLRTTLRTIARTTFSGSDMDEKYMRGNRDAHTTCARMAIAALGADGETERE